MTGWNWVRIGAVLGFLAVAFGAFGAHGLKARLEHLGTAGNYQTAAQYHIYHALAILAVGLMAGSWKPGNAANVAGWSFLFGVLLFSGSLYVLAVTGIKWLGAITPIGGLALLVGWAALAVAASGTPPAALAGWTFHSPATTLNADQPTPPAHSEAGARP